MTNPAPSSEERPASTKVSRGLMDRLPGLHALRNLTIGRKFNTGFGILVGLTVAVVGLSFFGSEQAIQDINRTGDLRVPMTLASIQAQTNLLKMLASVQGYLVLSDPRYREDYQQAKQAFETNLAELEAPAADQTAEDRLRLDELKTTFEKWVTLPERLFELHDNPGENQAALRIARLDLQPLSATILSEIDRIIVIQEQRQPSIEQLALLKDMVAFRSSFNAKLAALRAYAGSGVPAFKFEYTASLTENESAWESLLENTALLSDDQQAHLASIIWSREQLLQLPSQIFDAVEGKRPYEDLYLFRTEAVPLAEEMLHLLEATTGEQQTSLLADLERGRQKLANAQIQTLVAGVLGLLLGLGLTFLSRANIVGPIRRLTDTAQQITAGNLWAQAEVEARDEIGQLATALNTMTGRLRETITGLEQRNQQLEALRQASLGLTSHLKLQMVLEAILEGTLKLLSEAYYAHIFLYEADRLTFGARRVVDSQLDPRVAETHLNDLAYSVARRGRPVVVSATSQPSLNGQPLVGGEGAIVGLPLEIGGRVVGVMMVDKAGNLALADIELEVLRLLADQAAVAIENARLYEQAQQEIIERKKVEVALKLYHDHLEELVEKRTAKLTEINQQLEQEIAERKRAEEQLKTSLQEKEVLLKEIHHRVKNNLQVVSSLLDLQADSLKDEQVGEMFRESQHRIKSMALIHERLYQSQNLAWIDFAEYVESLTNYLVRSYSGRGGHINLQVNIAPLSFSIETAIPCGLIINELVSNAMKHAFPNGRSGEIRVELQKTEAQWVSLVVKDDGIGLPSGVDFRRTTSLGLTLVMTLVRQLKGTIELSGRTGTEFQISFVNATTKIGELD